MNSKLQQAIVATRAGRARDAQLLLAQAIKDNPRDADAWFLFSHLVESNKRQITYLEQAIALDPSNQRARQRLAQLKASNTPAGPVAKPIIQSGVGRTAAHEADEAPRARPTPPPPRPIDYRTPAWLRPLEEALRPELESEPEPMMPTALKPVRESEPDPVLESREPEPETPPALARPSTQTTTTPPADKAPAQPRPDAPLPAPRARPRRAQSGEKLGMPTRKAPMRATAGSSAPQRQPQETAVSPAPTNFVVEDLQSTQTPADTDNETGTEVWLTRALYVLVVIAIIILVVFLFMLFTNQ